jgi:RNA polymerase sigma-70 factor (ECF subfamily)
MLETDELLMLRAGNGDRAACTLLVERHLGRIVTFARRTLCNGGDAEDAAQEVFLRVWSAAPRWRNQARFTTWLYRVAMNVCLDRNAKRRETIPAIVPDLPDSRPEPSALAEAAEEARRVREALAALPDTQRVAITLSHYQGLRNIDAAQIVGVSVDAFESLLARGRRAMRARLQSPPSDHHCARG